IGEENMNTDMISRLMWFCTNADGSKRSRGALPRGDVHCADLYDARFEIERLRDIERKLIGETSQIAADRERLRVALRKIADLVDAEDSFEPLDEAISIAQSALEQSQERK